MTEEPIDPHPILTLIKRRAIANWLKLQMFLIWPLRFFDVWPAQTFRAGDPVPFWVELKYPKAITLDFVLDCDVEFNWRDGKVHLYPLEEGETIMVGNDNGPLIPLIVVCGAPTITHDFDGKRRRRKAKDPVRPFGELQGAPS